MVRPWPFLLACHFPGNSVGEIGGKSRQSLVHSYLLQRGPIEPGFGFGSWCDSNPRPDGSERTDCPTRSLRLPSAPCCCPLDIRHTGIRTRDFRTPWIGPGLHRHPLVWTIVALEPRARGLLTVGFTVRAGAPSTPGGEPADKHDLMLAPSSIRMLLSTKFDECRTWHGIVFWSTGRLHMNFLLA